MVEKNLKKLKAKKHRVMATFNTGTRDMKLKTAYRRKKKWSADDADHFRFSNIMAGLFRACCVTQLWGYLFPVPEQVL